LVKGDWLLVIGYWLLVKGQGPLSCLRYECTRALLSGIGVYALSPFPSRRVADGPLLEMFIDRLEPIAVSSSAVGFWFVIPNRSEESAFLPLFLIRVYPRSSAVRFFPISAITSLYPPPVISISKGLSRATALVVVATALTS
jgi:hypothetical protein